MYATRISLQRSPVTRVVNLMLMSKHYSFNAHCIMQFFDIMMILMIF